MIKSCLQCGINFEITDADLAFYKRVSPSFNRPAQRGGFKQVYEIPPPKLCPDCRQQRRLAFRNERKLYSRKCDLCQKEIVAIYPANAPFPVYCSECWYSDKWDATEHGQEIDLSKTFFEQFNELQKRIPRIALLIVNTENCNFCNIIGDCKNCYLLFGSVHCEDCYYGSPYFSKNCVDSFVIRNSELCYECIDSEKLYHCRWCQNCENSHDLILCFDCNNCENCFGCTGLRHKKYHVFNQPISKEKYKKFVLENNPLDSEIQKKFQQLKEQTPRRFMIGTQNEKVSGNQIWNSKNVQQGFGIEKCEDGKDIYQIIDGKNLQDINFGEHGELIYEQCGFYHANQLCFSLHCWNGIYNLYYCDSCALGTNNCFGSISLQQKKYCILNKQYTKEEYEELVPRIIEHMQKTPLRQGSEGQAGEWGEFFPVEISPFAYNETVAQEYFPMTKEEVLATRSFSFSVPLEKGETGGLKPQGDNNSQIKSSGANPPTPLVKGGLEQEQRREPFLHWRWRDEDNKIPDVKKIIPAEKLPDSIQDIPDDILNWAIKCEKSGKLFRIQKAELDFYRKMNLPIPHFHPDIRHQMRMEKRNPRKLWKRTCAECKIEIETTYAPERPEKVLCEECYLKVIN